MWRVAQVILLPCVLAASAAVEDDTCSTPQGSKASSLLQARGTLSQAHLAAGTVARLSCAPLQLADFDYTGCEALEPGASCLVSCPAGLVGRPVRYYCFRGLADLGHPPAALYPPVCFNSTSPFVSGAQLPLKQIGRRGCLSCPSTNSRCAIVEGDPAQCSDFTIDLDAMAIKASGQCLFMYLGPELGLKPCNGGEHAIFKAFPSEEWLGASELCVDSGRGRLCVGQADLPEKLFASVPEVQPLQPALDALTAGDNETFVRQMLAVQTCRAKLESGVPDEFWSWLSGQPDGLRRALLATFPVHPGQVRLFHEIRESFGHGNFDEFGLGSFSVAVSYVQRGKGIDEAVRFPHPSFERNDAGFLAGEEDRIRQEMIDGEHCKIQSNECKNLHTCCGPPETWQFKWPRDPSPSVRDWVHWMVNQTVEHPDSLWMNPLQVPWLFGVYIWPSPIAECEWVHDKLVRGEEMEGKWYLYDSSFHNRICDGGEHHPDALPGIAVYGGVCGRMAQLEWRKTGCMGMPATMKGEPGHCAGMKFQNINASWTPLNVISEVEGLSFLHLVGPDSASESCLSCKKAWKSCDLAPPNSADCTKFEYDPEAERIRPMHNTNQCVIIKGGATPGLYKCSGGVHQVATTTEEGSLSITSSRGSLLFLRVPIPGDPSEENRCLRCSEKGSLCEYAVAGSEECTEFGYDPSTGLIHAPNRQCLHTFSGPAPGLKGCSETEQYQIFALVNSSQLKIESSRGKLLLVRPDGGVFPEARVHWQYKGIHEISCTKDNCKFHSVLSLDSAEILQKRHKEAALAAVEGFNKFETDDIWPAAHDEARLAASAALALRNAGVPNQTTEELVAWALRRNPASYDAWQLAADYPAGGPLDADGQPSRDSLASHQWHETLQLLRLSASGLGGRHAADSFARKHLLASDAYLRKMPQLMGALVNRLCGELSNSTLEELGDTAAECALLQNLSAGIGWTELQEDMVEAEIGDGNCLSDEFESYWKVMAKLISFGIQDGNSSAVVDGLLSELSVGYINIRSHTFFGEHGRVLLRGPYAHVLQIAGGLFPVERRRELFNQTRAILTAPQNYSDRLLGSSEGLLDEFLTWLPHHISATSNTTQASSVSDGVDGFGPDDTISPEIVVEFQLDMDAEMELGAKFWDEAHELLNEDDRYDIDSVLGVLLQLPDESAAGTDATLLEGSSAKSQTLQGSRQASMQRKAAKENTKESQAAKESTKETPATGTGPSNSELLQYCIADELSQDV